MSADLLCMGEPMLEFNQLPAEPDGRVLYLEGHGGDTSNAAIAAARQGAKAGYITALGQDFAGDSFMALWAREGVDTSGMVRSADKLTGVYFVFHGAKGHEFLHYRQNSAASAFTVADLPREALGRARVFFASGISQGISDSATDAVFEAIRLVKQGGGLVGYDTNYRPRLWPPARAAAVMNAAIAQADFVFPGMDDAAALLRLSDADAIVDFYLRLGPKVVVLKMGVAGALLATPERRVRIAALPVTVVDATGAGDTFCGSFLARIIAGGSPEQAARHANVAAALKCTGYGAVAPIPTLAQVMAALG
ncbi:MAG: sugar kinase [Acetobacteraceae bacterium]